VLATDNSPVSMIGASPLITGLHRRTDEVANAFRTGKGIAWGAQDPAIFESAERFFGVHYRNGLISEWLPALDGMHERLEAGGYVADIGCGHGTALILLAKAYPRSRFVGFDTHELSIQTARKRAADAGLSHQVRFEVAHCHEYPADGYDLITFFATFHDLGDPVGAAAHARTALADDGALMLAEPFALDNLADNLALPGAGLHYAASTFLCVPNSLSEPVGLALGAQPGEPRLREVLAEAGYRTVRRAAQTPFNLVLEARP
jgi:SAM-dependent methyltransferase